LGLGGLTLSALWAICRRDVVAAFSTPLAWLVLACWTFLVNAIFVYTLHVVYQEGSSGQPLFVNSLSLGIFFLTLLAPAITMNSFASERVQGTMQLLLTVPIREHQMLLGKFAAAFLILLSLVAAMLVQPLLLLFISEIHVAHVAAGYLGMVLSCAFFAALGVWISLLVDSPVAAYVLTFGAIMILQLVGIGGDDGPLGPIGRAIGLHQRSSGFFTGQVRLGDALYFICGTSVFLVLAHASLTARRVHG
jgi:ABC-2 type transport system permease protein